eukprot:TRINITY_DN1390_c0_g1_i1.p1 TRINITY_DN1390_c0_g1~~TRINITY_DN1390_c0_g1_i1.p1  ORF type:complete len:517 (+),score=121.99 TRINITY_DN1390_c0_g1_i1:66-1616(+)
MQYRSHYDFIESKTTNHKTVPRFCIVHLKEFILYGPIIDDEPTNYVQIGVSIDEHNRTCVTHRLNYNNLNHRLHALKYNLNYLFTFDYLHSLSPSDRNFVRLTVQRRRTMRRSYHKRYCKTYIALDAILHCPFYEKQIQIFSKDECDKVVGLLTCSIETLPLFRKREFFNHFDQTFSSFVFEDPLNITDSFTISSIVVDDQFVIEERKASVPLDNQQGMYGGTGNITATGTGNDLKTPSVSDELNSVAEESDQSDVFAANTCFLDMVCSKEIHDIDFLTDFQFNPAKQLSSLENDINSFLSTVFGTEMDSKPKPTKIKVNWFIEMEKNFELKNIDEFGLLVAVDNKTDSNAFKTKLIKMFEQFENFEGYVSIFKWNSDNINDERNSLDIVLSAIFDSFQNNQKQFQKLLIWRLSFNIDSNTNEKITINTFTFNILCLSHVTMTLNSNEVVHHFDNCKIFSIDSEIMVETEEDSKRFGNIEIVQLNGEIMAFEGFQNITKLMITNQLTKCKLFVVNE